jgi:cell wall assembly regulator SMI1
MNEDWIAQLLGLIDAHEDIRMGVAATDSAIGEAESELGVSFPLRLRTYLTTFGHLEIGHHELYGLGPDIPHYLSIVKETVSERKEFRPYIPVHLLPIENDGGGNHYCLDISSTHDDPPIVFWSHDDDEEQVPDIVSSSFTSWLLEVADETLEA